MGLWTRHPFWPLEPFIASLRRTAFDGDVCIFVDDVPRETVASLQAHGVIVERAGPSAQPRMAALSSRFFNYLEFLAPRSEQYANVMLSDLRDVVFQSDPFAAPLPAEIVYAQERRLLADSPLNRAWVVQGYGESVAHNMRNCLVSCAGTTLGTTRGILRYLAAMTRELAGRATPITGGIDQGIHNYVVHMLPLRNAWFDPTDSIVATMHFVPDASIRISEQGVLIDNRLVPVLHQWDRNATTHKYVESAPRFRIATPSAAPPVTADDVVVAFYHRERDAEWLPFFLTSLRCVGFNGPTHCIGEFNAGELQLLAEHGCIAHPIAPTDRARAENVAHFYLDQLLDNLAANASTAPDQVLVLDSTRAVFLRDPFLTKTIGLSAFCEGPTQMGESSYNQHRLSLFVPPDEARLQRPVVSSALLRGPLDVVRTFYRRLLAEFIGKASLLNVPKSIQGAFNKLCHDGGLGVPIIAHPNAAEAYFDFWPSGLAINRQHGIHIGGTVPAVVLGESAETELLRAIRINLRLPAP